MSDDDFKHDWMMKEVTNTVTRRIYFRATQTKAEEKYRKKRRSTRMGRVTLYMLTLWPVDV